MTMRRNREPDTKHFDFAQMEEQSADLLELRYLNKENATFRRTLGGFVSLVQEGKTFERVGIYRTFPFTNPDRYISIREADEKAREIGVIKDLNIDLSKEEAKMLQEQLELRYFTPIIKKLNDIKEEYGYAYFDVRTNFGSCKFTIQMSGGTVIPLTEYRILITDLDGNRYEIPDLRKLSGAELKKLDLFL